MAFRSKWLDWQSPPGKQNGPGVEPAKPSKPPFAGFAGAVPGPFGQSIEPARADAVAALQQSPFAVIDRAGYWHYAARAAARGRVTQDAQAVVILARRQGFRLVADNVILRFDTPARPDDYALRHLCALAPDVLAVLHRESDRRLGRDGDAA